jgi:thioredoxin 1
MLSITNLQNFYGQNECPKKVNTCKEVDHLTSTEDHELAEIERKKIALMLQRAQVKSQSDQTNNGKPITLTDACFSSEVAKQKLIVVDFWAPWCGPCRMVGPLIEQLAAEYAGKVAFGKINVDDNQMIPSQFGVQGIPTLIVFKNGEPVETIVGACPKTQIELKFRPHIEKTKNS